MEILACERHDGSRSWGAHTPFHADRRGSGSRFASSLTCLETDPSEWCIDGCFNQLGIKLAAVVLCGLMLLAVLSITRD
eukprot:SAG11_NODE_13533_length_651_cov_0.625000_1_plen_78_part_01